MLFYAYAVCRSIYIKTASFSTPCQVYILNSTPFVYLISFPAFFKILRLLTVFLIPDYFHALYFSLSPNPHPSMNILQRAASADAGDAGGFQLYHYHPTVAGGVIFTLLFIATTSLHGWQLYRGRSWFLIPLTVGGFCKILTSDLPTSRLIMILFSRAYRICSEMQVRQRISRLDSRALYHPEPPPSGSTSTLRCNDLHGARQNCFND